MTAVGKIFKPALRYDAVKKVFESELKTLSGMADSIDVTVKEDKVHGTIAIITASPAAGTDVQEIRKHIESILGNYTLYYQVNIGD